MGRFYPISLLVLLAATLGMSACRVVEDDLPQVQQPAPTPPPAPATANPTDSTEVPIDSSHWRHFNLRSRSFEAPAPGRFEFGSNGVEGYNDAAGYGSILATTFHYSLNNRTIRLIWRCYDGGTLSHYAVALADSSGLLFDNAARFTDLTNMATRTAYGSTALIWNNTWYYTTLTTQNGQYTLSTAANDFTENGGYPVDRRSGTLPYLRGRIVLRSDQPGSSRCQVLVNRLSIR